MTDKTPKQHEQVLKHRQELAEIARNQIQRRQVIEAREAHRGIWLYRES